MAVRLAALVSLMLLSSVAAQAQDYESHVITIDASSPQPVGTGFIPAVSTGEVIVLAEGNLHTVNHADRYDQGWFDPGGQTRLQRGGQLVMSGMPYGALIGGFSTNTSLYRFVGKMGAFHLEPYMVGQEFRVTLNMSAADLAILQGTVTVTVIFLQDGYPDIAQVVINESTTPPVGTGLVAALNDQFVILPYGMLQTNYFPPFSDGYFGPEGLPKFNRSGQPYPEGPYGGLYGYFLGPNVPFYLGDGGMWKAGVPAVGHELYLTLNLDPVDLAGSDGRFIVNVIRVPQ